METPSVDGSKRRLAQLLVAAGVITSNTGRKIMKHVITVFGALLGGFLLVSAGHAQTTNSPATAIETAELLPDAVIVKGFGSAGSVNIGPGALSVGLKETSVDNNRRWYGLALEYIDSAKRERAVLDDDEIQPLLKGMDYLATITYNATTLPGFQAVFQTRSGFRVIAVGTQGQNNIQTFVQFYDYPRIPLETTQLSQIRNVIAQGLNNLDALKSLK
jgi:hypothetical protein